MVYNLATSYANAMADRANVPGMCLQQVRTWWGIGSRYGSAIVAWQNANVRHRVGVHADAWKPPKGAVVYYDSPASQYGHIAYSLGGGYVRSTDVAGRGLVGTVPLNYFKAAWGQAYLGWAEDLNEVKLPLAMPIVLPKVDCSNLTYAATKDADHYPYGTTIVQKALAKLVGLDYSSGPGVFGPRTKAAYAAFEKKYGYTANGVPDMTSLTSLGRKSGLFTVVV